MTLNQTLMPIMSTRSARSAVSSEIYRLLRRAIVSLELLPGDQISEAEVSKQVGTSRQPVREAFIKLSETGFVDIVPQRGTLVRQISLEEVEGALFLRAHMEAAVARRACQNVGMRSIKKLRTLIEAQKEAAERDDHALFLDRDDEFHQTIGTMARCQSVWRVVDDLKAQVDRMRFISLPEALPFDMLIRQHVQIVNAIERCDGDIASSLMLLHVSEVIPNLHKIAMRHHALFSDVSPGEPASQEVE